MIGGRGQRVAPRGLHDTRRRRDRHGTSRAFVSTDAGDSWTEIEPTPGQHLAGAQVACVGNSDLWLLQGPLVWHSSNAGTTWKNSSLPVGAAGSRIGFLDEQFGWVTTGGRDIVITRDGGATWESHDLVCGNIPFDFATFLDPKTGIALRLGSRCRDGRRWQSLATGRRDGRPVTVQGRRCRALDLPTCERSTPSASTQVWLASYHHADI